jgi:hypothetical protein
MATLPILAGSRALWKSTGYTKLTESAIGLDIHVLVVLVIWTLLVSLHLSSFSLDPVITQSTSTTHLLNNGQCKSPQNREDSSAAWAADYGQEGIPCLLQMTPCIIDL